MVSAIFFQSIGKPVISGLISFSRQIIFLIPAIMILCSRIGLMGVLWAGPVADGLAFVLALLLVIREMTAALPKKAGAAAAAVGC